MNLSKGLRWASLVALASLAAAAEVCVTDEDCPGHPFNVCGAEEIC